MNTNTIIHDCNTIKSLADKIIRELSVNALYVRNSSNGFGSGIAFAPVFSTHHGEDTDEVTDTKGSFIPVSAYIKPNRTIEEVEESPVAVVEDPVLTDMMNRSIISVNHLTHDEKVRAATAWLIAHRNRMCIAEFVKKDGSVRTMKFLPRNEYNHMLGIVTTEFGRSIVRTKVCRDMIVVAEVCDDNRIQARTINLRTLNSLRLAA